jgi:CpXC protein
MSIFYPITIHCPECREPNVFQASASVNADRRADLREAILDGTFQRQACTKCKTNFRLDPELNYLDVSRDQWIAAFPVSRLGDWEIIEKSAQEMFDRAYGTQASETAREIGADLKPRLVFGWAALREKLICDLHLLDDISLELVKITMMRNMEDIPLSDQTELRLIDVKDGHLEMAWMMAMSERLVERMGVPMDLYQEIHGDVEAWTPLRDQLSCGIFVDVQRLLVGTT